MFRLLALVAALSAAPAHAQYTGPTTQGQTATVAEAENARIGRYLTLTGTIVSHMRGDYYMFQDETGQIRVEIAPGVFAGQQVGPETVVTITGEVDRRAGIGPQYLWVNSLSVVE